MDENNSNQEPQSENSGILTTSNCGLGGENNVIIGYSGANTFIGADSAASCKIREINIKPCDFGFNVTIGCQTFAVESSKKLLKNLKAYFKDPATVEHEWLVNKKLL